MTHSTRSLITIMVLATTAALTPIAGADYNSVNSLVGGNGETAGYSSTNAILADSGNGVAPQNDAFSTVNSITGSEPVTASPPQLATAGDGFDWGDASIGAAAGASLVVLLGLTVVSRLRRQTPQVQASV